MDFPFESDIYSLRTPCYLVSEKALKHNMEILLSVRKRTGCKILLAQKAFSMYAAYSMMRPYIDGTTASGLFEAKLGHEEFGGETHVFSPAYKKEDMAELVKICDDIIFNSFSQWKLHRGTVKNSSRKVSCGIRCNPLYSEIDTDIYNPCFTGSRLGVTPENFENGELDGIEGLHFHTMCEQGADVLARTVPHIEEHFGEYIKQMKWLNLGGGHHITREGYDVDLLCKTVDGIQQKYGVQVYLEPGEACALNAGWLVTEVLDIGKNGIEFAIVDTSAACHMPDVLEMPYRPEIIGAGKAGEKKHVYRLGGPTCLAGDIIGDYAFDEPLKAGDRLVFCDMAIYSMCKNNTFNGMPLPEIYLEKLDGSTESVKRFGYEDFKCRV
ncbi:carboxynorspermidine decarboxylase [Ruminococcus albus]|uniref:Carboxynorspermidine decarboxylase n=1 Tax=Ruminococcus albus TaxID=1264 RepID=A0A1I1L101_RUMAL|nr:carboxynorspermidine decarboxylase [Ruminococcus albus]SFC64073.1 carboxynorspermidine decarboxylase [Ruminococcus albus]